MSLGMLNETFGSASGAALFIILLMAFSVLAGFWICVEVGVASLIILFVLNRFIKGD
jgi:hypothetical protein